MSSEEQDNEEAVQEAAQEASEIACAEAWQNSQYGDDLEAGFSSGPPRTAALTLHGRELRLFVDVCAQVPDDETLCAYPTSVGVTLECRPDIRGEASVHGCVSFEEAVLAAYRKCMEAVCNIEPWRSIREAGEIANATPAAEAAREPRRL